MGKLIFQMMISIDGFIEDEKASLDWHLVDDEFNAHAIELFERTDIILFGRRTYEMMYSYWPAPLAAQNDPRVTRYMNELPKIVCSATLHKTGWNNTRLVKENISEEVRKIKQEENKNIWLMGSSDVAVTLGTHGLIDEYLIIISPVFLGNGKQIMQGIKNRLKLKLTGSRIFKNGNTMLQYQPQ